MLFTQAQRNLEEEMKTTSYPGKGEEEEEEVQSYGGRMYKERGNAGVV